MPHFPCLEIPLRDPKEFQEYNYKGASFVLGDFPGESIEGKAILDLGCGDGGKTVYYACHGARKAVGVDPNPRKFPLAQNFAQERNCQNGVEFISASGTDLPLKEETFDSIISSSVLEHVDREELLPLFSECYRVLKKGGQFLVRFHPYRSRLGTHINFYVAIPWCQYFFHEQVLLEIVKERHLQRMSSGGDHFYDSTKLMASKHLWEINHLNRLTLKEFESIIKQTPFRIAKRYPSNKGLERFLARLPLIREFLTNHGVYVLEKT